MRVISGKAKGRRLIGPKGGAVRPTADRIKESLFNILPQDFSGMKILELFAGTGNVSIEAFRDGFSRLYEKATLAGSPFIFINAWNEWAEGAYLEPDEERGTALLDVIKSVVAEGRTLPQAVESRETTPSK